MLGLVQVLGAAALLAFLQVLLTRYRRHLSALPGPLLASFSNLWKIAAVYHDDMPGWNIHAHEKYGPVVRIGPKHVSFSSPTAFQAIYNQQQLPKSEFYEVGAPSYQGTPLENMFSLRDVQQHHALRKNIGHLYTKTAVKDFEPLINSCVDLFLRRIEEQTETGPTVLNMSLWLHFYSYECLTETNTSRKLGFLEQGKDVNGVIAFSDKIFSFIGILTQSPLLHQLMLYHLGKLETKKEPEPIMKYTVDEVEMREKNPSQKVDMLSKLTQVSLDRPDKVSMRDVTAAVFINLTAGHDVLAITLRAIWYYLARNTQVVSKLREELDATGVDAQTLIPLSTLSELPYLNAVIQEVMRVHPNTGTIIERVTPPEGTIIDGHTIPGGTIVGVNAWVLHRDKDIFGDDADVFRPERWLEASDKKKMEMKKHIFSFGAGAHTCIGRNMAMIMLTKAIAGFYRRFDASLANPEPGWRVHGGWVTKQTGLDMVLNRRAVGD